MATFPIFDACTLCGAWPQHAADLSVESLLAMMTQNNIARSFITSSSGIFYDYQRGNEETSQIARAYPQQLLPVGTLDPRAYPGCLDELQKRAGEGFRLFRFFPDRQGWPLSLASFVELVRKCDELGVLVAVNIAKAGDCSQLAQLVGGGKTPLIISGVTGELLGEAICVARAQPNFYFETARLTAPNALEAVRDGVPDGVNRLIFASYSPLRYLSAALGPVLTSSLSDEDKALVLGGNLRRLLTK